MVDGFFDCLNVRSTTDCQKKQKLFLAPYTSLEDERFQWLLELLDYLQRWKESTKNRPENFTPTPRGRMFVSWQTLKGFQISLHSAIEATKFLLQEDMEFVLTEQFCQDPLEEYFGSQRKLDRQNDNPDIKTFEYNNTIHNHCPYYPLSIFLS